MIIYVDELPEGICLKMKDDDRIFVGTKNSDKEEE